MPREHTIELTIANKFTSSFQTRANLITKQGSYHNRSRGRPPVNVFVIFHFKTEI